MIKNFSSHLKSLGTKGLVVLIALSFAVWGIGDIFTNNQNPTIAKVGSIDIKLNEFNLEYQNILSRLRQSTSEPITDEFVKAMGLHNNIMQNLITRKYISLLSKDLKLNVGDKYLKKTILNNPMFKDQLGVFNKDYFKYYLNQNNVSEKELLEINRNLLVNNLFIQTLNVNNYVPYSMTENVIKKRDTARKAIVYEFDSSSYLFKNRIEDDEIRKKYETIKNTLLSPEERDITLIKIDTTALSKEILIDENKVKDFYNSNIDYYKKEETRSLYQPIFDTKSELETFVNNLKKNKNILEAIKKAGLSKEDVFLKEISKNDLDKELQNQVFSLKEGEITQPFKTAFGYKIFYLEKINESSIQSYEELRESIIDDFRKEELNNQLYDTANKIFEKFLDSKDLDLALKNKKVIKREFKNLKIKDVSKIYKNTNVDFDENELAKYIFNLNLKELSETFEDNNGDIYFIYLNKITKQSIKSYSSAKAEVLELLFQEKRNQLAKSKAEEFLLAIKNNSFEEYDNKIYRKYTTDWLTFDKRLGDKINRNLKEVIFNNKIDTFSEIFKIDLARYVIVKTIEQKLLDQNNKNLTSTEKISSEYSESINNDLFDALLFDLRKKHNSNVNENFLKSF
ncbi:MAG: hypothetical protein CMP24_01280 [Rickettsiales bacterium]|nr:hypothetical protein [Rickettsiales bacterium]